MISSIVASSFPYRMFSAMLSAKRNTSCCTTQYSYAEIPVLLFAHRCHQSKYFLMLHHRIAESADSALSYHHQMIRQMQSSLPVQYEVKHPEAHHDLLHKQIQHDQCQFCLLHPEVLSHPERLSASPPSASVVHICADWLFHSQSVPQSLKAFVPDSRKWKHTG